MDARGIAIIIAPEDAIMDVERAAHHALVVELIVKLHALLIAPETVRSHVMLHVLTPLVGALND